MMMMMVMVMMMMMLECVKNIRTMHQRHHDYLT